VRIKAKDKGKDKNCGTAFKDPENQKKKKIIPV
jgi:hypothetical protein